jgi:hypothetical protein
MRKYPQRFTGNKQVVRDLQCETITTCLASRLGGLSYFGLPSTSLDDVKQWAAFFKHISAVERGEAGREWEFQHDLELEAFRCGLFDKLTLLRGDIDQIILTGKDSNGKPATFPFDVVSLDYSGGLFYTDSQGRFSRIEAIGALVERQSVAKTDFVLLISCNLDGVNQGEVRKSLGNVQTAMSRAGQNAGSVMEHYLNSPHDQARLKVYVPYMVNQFASKARYHCTTQPTIMYSGNLQTKMMAFRFYLNFDGRTAALREPRERVAQIMNTPMINVVDGVQRRTSLDLPKLRVKTA